MVLIHHQALLVVIYRTSFFKLFTVSKSQLTAVKDILRCLAAQNLHGMKFKPLFENVPYQMENNHAGELCIESGLM